MSRPTFLVSGSLAIDRILDFPGRFRDHLLPKKLHAINVSFLVSDLRESFGGTAGNIGFNLALFGERVVLLPAAGRDFGPYDRWLRRHGVDTKRVPRRRGLLTSSAYIITDRDDNQIAGFLPGAMTTSGAVLPSGWRGRRYVGVVAAGSLSDMRRYPRHFAARSIPYLYDPSQQLPRLSRNDLLVGLRRAAMLMTNDYELAMLLRRSGLTFPKLQRTVPIIVTTLGRRGSIIRANVKRIRVPAAKPRDERDPTGAGDAYRAGFLVGWVRGWPLPVCGRLGAVSSVYTVERNGTQTHSFSWADIKRRYRKNFHHSFPR